MARFVAGVALGLALGLIVTVRADDTDEVMAAATEAGVQPEDLTAALASLDAAGISATPRSYLESVGELAAQTAPVRLQPVAGATVAGGGAASTSGWPIGGALGARIYCIEEGESSHGRFMFNPTPVAPWSPEHAQGYLGFLPSTARRWGAVIGVRSSEWNAAARMIQAGAGAQFAGIASGRC